MEYFSIALSLRLVNRVDILIKRSKARTSMMLWEEALNDAQEVYIYFVPQCFNPLIERRSLTSAPHPIEGTRSGMPHYMARAAMQKPLKHLI